MVGYLARVVQCCCGPFKTLILTDNYSSLIDGGRADAASGSWVSTEHQAHLAALDPHV